MGIMIEKKEKILFLCTHNSARSQIAEGILNTLYADKYQAFSAGVKPSHVSSFAIESLMELGIDISNHRSKNINEFQNENFDFVITLCDNAKESCPFLPGKKVIHKCFDDPASIDGSIDEILIGFRKIRDEIKEWLINNFGDKKNESINK
jgi:arsenate reductase